MNHSIVSFFVLVMGIRNRPNAAGSYYRALPESACRQKSISLSPVMIALNNDDNFLGTESANPRACDG
ncbi:hypothetical protein HX037_09500 [Ignatzschineria indica]|uniref:hypothetical protein n=1 Tax=Ignatzschineria indica TaxID=472583 RepID=UPI002577C0E2|nr:hypothetical protein [Ignatzschineria indica]MDM1546108.1 hypothetical protein [Ignatzschineria indica]